MDSQVQEIAERLGLTFAGDPVSVRPGLGGNELWRLTAADDAPTAEGGPTDVLLRLFPVGAPTLLAEREAAVQTLVAAHGVPTPAVLGCDRVADRPVLAMEWVTGPLVSERLWAGDDAGRLGARCGTVLANLHRIEADRWAELDRELSGRTWLDWAGPRADDLRRYVPDADSSAGHRLLHLDFHPENLLLHDNTVVLLDWANTRIGPPAAELARTASIIDLVHDHPELGPDQRTAIIDFGNGLLTGYTGAGGTADVPAVVRAWAAAVQLIDLTADWVPAGYHQRLRRRFIEIVADLASQPPTGP